MALLLFFFVAAGTACSPATDDPVGLETPEAAVVAWFGAIDSGDYESVAGATHSESLVLIFAIENDLDAATIAGYLDGELPLDVQAAYWQSFADGFAEFASRPISTLTVGESEQFTAEGVEFASVPIGGSGERESIVFVRQHSNGMWEVDLVATLGDGFTRLLGRAYDALPADEAGDRIRRAYVDTVVPALWAAMADGSYGDRFTRSALALIDRIAGTSEMSGVSES